jgi:predicted anti-sigma-YlaC factor YlaD
MNCAEFEIVLADYLDGTLQAGERAAIAQHSNECAACREFLRDVSGGMSLLRGAEEVEPPPALITRIAYQAPIGRTRHPFEQQGFWSRLASKWLQPILQPRLAMGMAMTVLSFAMLERCTGVHVQHIQAADLSPVRIWGGVEDKACRVRDRAVKYYENLRFVYEIETRLKDLEEQPETPPSRAGSNAGSAGQGQGQTSTNGGGSNPPAQDSKR